jgi:hypothetical protein
MSTIEQWIVSLRGDDTRLMRWDATDHTVRQQNDNGCSGMTEILQEIESWESLQRGDEDNLRFGIVCEYLTFCITDNPKHRAKLHGVDHFYETIVGLLSKAPSDKATSLSLSYPPAYARKYYASAMAAHLIYIASFADATNHQGFIEADAVPALAELVQHGDQPIQAMWAAAALQNLAASYCATPDDGRCYWDWTKTKKKYMLQIRSDSLPMTSDGSLARQQIRSNDALIQALQKWACQGPAAKKKDPQNPRPGDNAIAWDKELRHEECPSIVPWATTGVLKNVALDISVPDAQRQVQSILNETALCLCRLVKSPDWLEANKANGVWAHGRAAGVPCWKLPNPREPSGKKRLCVDYEFRDAHDYSCSDYGETTSRAECQASNPQDVKPSSACCGCGGGQWDNA